jgi:hypothetical protein
MKIVSIRIKPIPQTMLNGATGVVATFEDGSVRSLFSFYPDEIVFEAAELIGLTEAEAVDLHRRKDVEFFRMCARQSRPKAGKSRVAGQLQER